MLVSVEIPVFKHHFLRETIESVKRQTYKNWKLLLLSDGASEEADEILRESSGGNIEAYFQQNQGIYKTRKNLTALSDSDFIVPLDHDDILFPTALEDMIACHKENQNAGIVRARRIFIDEKSQTVNEREWFPFSARTLVAGMTIDVHNHCQPYMIKREAYKKTDGWNGFDEFGGAGEDCDIFLKIEEVADIVLLDKVLYGYRINPNRFSLDLGFESAKKMWCTLTDQTIKRRGLAIKRINEMPPFYFIKKT